MVRSMSCPEVTINVVIGAVVVERECCVWRKRPVVRSCACVGFVSVCLQDIDLLLCAMSVRFEFRMGETTWRVLSDEGGA
jgi:hypothetical protein